MATTESYRESRGEKTTTTYPRTIGIGAIVLIFTGVQFVISEAIAASAWVHPPYSYARNYISDLGVTVCGDKPTPSLNPYFTQAGQVLCSPLNVVLNTCFVLTGLLVLIGALLLMGLLPRPARYVELGLAVICALGVGAAGFVHAQSQSLTNGTIIFHVLGAFCFLISIHLSIIMNGVLSRRVGAPRWFVGLSIVLGIVGLLAAVLIAIPVPILTPPVFERTSAYIFVGWSIITGILLLQGRRTGRLKVQ